MADSKPAMRTFTVVTDDGDKTTVDAAYYVRDISGDLVEFKNDQAKIVFAVPISRLVRIFVVAAAPATAADDKVQTVDFRKSADVVIKGLAGNTGEMSYYGRYAFHALDAGTDLLTITLRPRYS